MGRSLRSLEQSLTKPKMAARKKPARSNNAQTKARNPAKIEEFSVSLSPQQLAPAQLQEQIDVIRGRRLAQPTRSLRALEDRLLGRPAIVPASRETLRLDNGQVKTPQPPSSLPPALPPATTINPALPATPTVHSSGWPTQHAAYAASLWPQTKSAVAAPAMAAPYAPEFSAPGIERFQVESFASPLSPESVFKPDPYLNIPSASNGSDITRTPSLPPVSAVMQPDVARPVLNVAPEDDAVGWLAQAQSEQPRKITGASRKSLDSDLTLAKNEFERELAAILGQPTTAPVPVVAPPTQPTPVKPPPDPSAPPPHPNHDVFDQMGLAMRYANSFDLGNINLQDRFNQIEQVLEPASAIRAPSVSAQNPFVDPYANPMSLDDFDLVAELAEISADKPTSATMPPSRNTPNSTDTTVGDYHE